MQGADKPTTQSVLLRSGLTITSPRASPREALENKGPQRGGGGENTKHTEFSEHTENYLSARAHTHTSAPFWHKERENLRHPHSRATPRRPAHCCSSSAGTTPHATPPRYHETQRPSGTHPLRARTAGLKREPAYGARAGGGVGKGPADGKGRSGGYTGEAEENGRSAGVERGKGQAEEARGPGRGAGREGKARPRGMCLRVPAAPPWSTRRRSSRSPQQATCTNGLRRARQGRGRGGGAGCGKRVGWSRCSHRPGRSRRDADEEGDVEPRRRRCWREPAPRGGGGEGGARAEGTVERRHSTAPLRLRRRPARVEPGCRGGGGGWATHRRAMPRRRSSPSPPPSASARARACGPSSRRAARCRRPSR